MPSNLDLVQMSGVAEMLGVTRQRADQLSRERGFPEPFGELPTGRVWRTVDIDKWQKANRQRFKGSSKA